MKVRILTIALAIFAGTFASCSKENDEMNNISTTNTSSTDDNSGGTGDNNVGNTGGTVAERQMAMINGQYVISSYYLNGSDRTSDFKSTQIRLADGNVMFGYSNGASYRGEWAMDASSNLMKMRIQGNDQMRLLDGAYKIVSNTERQLVLTNAEDPSMMKKIVLNKVRVRRSFNIH